MDTISQALHIAFTQSIEVIRYQLCRGRGGRLEHRLWKNGRRVRSRAPRSVRRFIRREKARQRRAAA